MPRSTRWRTWRELCLGRRARSRCSSSQPSTTENDATVCSNLPPNTTFLCPIRTHEARMLVKCTCVVDQAKAAHSTPTLDQAGSVGRSRRQTSGALPAGGRRHVQWGSEGRHGLCDSRAVLSRGTIHEIHGHTDAHARAHTATSRHYRAYCHEPLLPHLPVFGTAMLQPPPSSPQEIHTRCRLMLPTATHCRFCLTFLTVAIPSPPW